MTSGEGSRNQTVAQSVAARQRGELTPLRAERREMLVDPYREKPEEGVDRSRGKVCAAVPHERERQRPMLAFLLSTPSYAPALNRRGWTELAGRH
jgi:hypothetical protein